MKKTNAYVLRVLAIMLASALGVYVAEAKGPDKNGSGNQGGLSKITGTPLLTNLNINNFTTFMRADGQGNHNQADQSGGVYPRGTASSIYEDGFVWGGKPYLNATYTNPPSNQPLRVGGQTYNQGTRQGKVIGTGATAVATDPAAPEARIYRIRRDYFQMTDQDARADAAVLNLVTNDAVTNAQIAAVRAQYATDWANWPVSLGAPYIERNGTPGYQAPPPFSANFTVDSLISGKYDEPGVAGSDPNSPADQVVWTVFNDLDRSFTLGLYGSEPLGLEGQVTLWGYKRTDALGNLYFKRLRFINVGGVDIGGGTKGSFYIDSMYVAQWSDPDLGDYGDDLCGSDTVLNVGYVYNGNAVDANYRKFNLPPPSVGYDFLAGPIVPAPGDSAVFDLKRVYDKKNLGLYGFVYFSAGSSISDPAFNNYESTTRWYKMLRGYQPDGNGVADRFYPFPPGVTPGPKTLYGDPVTGVGPVDGLGQTFSLAPGDRRIILTSGPFRMAPGDTQDVVMGTVGGLGSDRLSSISVMKFNDRFVQNTFDALFAVPKPPPTPDVKYTELDGHVTFEWGSNLQRVKDIEGPTFEPGGYTFEGYNVYQMKSNSSTDLNNAVRVATFDLLTDPAVVLDQQFDQASGQILLKPVQFGTNSGITRFFDFNRDYVNDIPRLNNGTPYTIAVTAYTVSRTGYLPAALESSPFFAPVTPHAPNPGVTIGQANGSDIKPVHTGTADGGPVVTVVEPGKLTGHNYQAYFTERAEIRNQSGDWVASSSISRAPNPNHPDTLTGSSIDIAAVYGISGGTTELHCTLNLVSVDFAYSDGIRMSLPAGVTIVNVPAFTAGNGDITPTWSGRTIVMGDTTHPYTGNGPFAGGEEWTIYVTGFTTPAPVAWKIFDDGYGTPLDAAGTTTVNTVGNASRMAKYWNLKDQTSGAVKLENQSVVNGVALFPPRDDVATNFGTSADPIVDGFQISMRNVGYAAPINFLRTTLTPGPNSTTTIGNGTTPSASGLVISNYTVFSGINTSTSNEAFGAGTTSLDQLQKDYELRFTGVPETTVVGGQTRITIKSGGQLGTIFSTVTGAAGLATHPLNPNPGTAAPFQIRIPFEVWCIDDNRQVNLAFRDRLQTPTANPFYAWNVNNRMYAAIVNDAYNANAPTPPNADATWALVFWSTNYKLGDVVKVTYANPIQFGVDNWAFGTVASSFSSAQAKNDVSKINVFPNPYYAYNPLEISRSVRFVTFNHLPAKATIRIFNLAGQLVRTLEKNDPSQFINWDLANENNYAVASGMYIVHVDMPDLGATKILKVAIIQEEEVPTNF